MDDLFLTIAFTGAFMTLLGVGGLFVEVILPWLLKEKDDDNS
jgi:hypothetical protein